jgi:hypothetical protein
MSERYGTTKSDFLASRLCLHSKLKKMMWSIIGVIILFLLVYGPGFYKSYRAEKKVKTDPIFYVYKIERDFHICKKEDEKIAWLRYCPQSIFREYEDYKSRLASKSLKASPLFTFTDRIQEAARITSGYEDKETRGPYSTCGYHWNTSFKIKEEWEERKAKIIVDMLSGKYDAEMARMKALEEQQAREKQEKEERLLNQRFASGDFVYQSSVYTENVVPLSLKTKTSEILRLTPLLIAADERKDEEAVGQILLEMDAVIR